MVRALMIAMGTICAAAWFPSTASAADNDQPLDVKKITLVASRSVKARKIRKGVIPPEYGITYHPEDYSKDDKLDIVIIKITVANKTGKQLEDLRVICEFYGWDVASKLKRRKKLIGPIGAEEAKVSFNAKNVFTCEFHKYTLYDKTQDVFTLGNPGQRITMSVPPYGISFFGYKVSLLSKDGNVIKEVLWPSKLSSIKLDLGPLNDHHFMYNGTLEDCVSPSKNPPQKANEKKN